MVENSVSSRPLKRARRSARVTADVPDFTAFPPAVSSVKPFRVAVRSFLSNNARLTVAFPPPVLPSLMTWQILFRVGDLVSDGPDLAPVVVALDVVEEDVTRSSRSVYCDQCRVVGWSGHPVCRKRYHFIIRSDNGGGMEGYYKSCSSCGNPLQFSDSRCKWCNQLINTDDFEDWVYSQFEDNTHLLHGVVHANGYGHLLTVNGREGGSNILSGSDIMNFWDRLCTALSVRSGPIDSCFGIIFSSILVDKDLVHWVDSILFGIIVMEYFFVFSNHSFSSSKFAYKMFSPHSKDGVSRQTNISSSIGLSPPQLSEKYPFNEPLYELILDGSDLIM